MRPNVEDPSFRTAAVRYSWLSMSSVPCPNHEASWITCSWSLTGSRLTVLDALNGCGATSVRPTLPS
ncbi:MAG: hypothetical protein DMD73_07405 [Gemmatimonadetes bacterium]|nr:MAG: hypothetical protein DMD73_07405 [Gemmatimonadota bacterium]